MAEASQLPNWVQPMLARLGPAFDSPGHLFELKWDGFRASVYADGMSYRLMSRRGHDMTRRYPEFGACADLPASTVLDGEIVALTDGKPDFQELLPREQARSEVRIRQLAATIPTTLVVFDLLYWGHQSVMARPLIERKELLDDLLRARGYDRLVLTEGMTGDGVLFFQQASAMGLEGIVAKRLDSSYAPGKRSDAWTKIKKREHALCAVIGFVATPDERDFQSLVVALDDAGTLRYAGHVGSGFNAAVRHRLNAALWSRVVEEPLVPSPVSATWVAPGVYCSVSFSEMMRGGVMRAAALEDVHVDQEGA